MRISANRIGRFLKVYLDDAYRDRKAEVCPQGRKKISQERIGELAEKEGWQSIEEILIDDKAIFSEKIPADQKLELLRNLFAETGTEYEAYADVTERRFVPK